jgi:Leucine-rich repeat (LRR) protein
MFIPHIYVSSLFLSLHLPSHSLSLSPTAGVESSLELLDLERNRLSNISAAFGQLTGLRYLYLSNNNISEVPEAAFQSFAETLQARGLQLYTFLEFQ